MKSFRQDSYKLLVGGVLAGCSLEVRTYTFHAMKADVLLLRSKCLQGSESESLTRRSFKHRHSDSHPISCTCDQWQIDKVDMQISKV